MRVPRPFTLLVGAAIATALCGRAASADLFVADGNAGEILRYDGTTGAYLGVFANDPGTPAGIALGPDGNLYVSNLSTQSVDEFSGADGSLIKNFVPSGSGGVIFPHDLTFGPDQNLYVDSGESDSILKYDGTTGASLGTFASGNGLYRPTGLVFHGGDLFVSNSKAGQILEFDGTTGAYVGVFASGNGLNGPAGLTFDSKGDLFVSNYLANNVLEFDPAGNFLKIFATGGGLAGPADAKFGPDGNLYVSGTTSNSIEEYDGTTGAFLGTVASGDPLNGPQHILFAAVPEPRAIGLLAVGMALIGVGRARRRRTCRVG